MIAAFALDLEFALLLLLLLVVGCAFRSIDLVWVVFSVFVMFALKFEKQQKNYLLGSGVGGGVGGVGCGVGMGVGGGGISQLVPEFFLKCLFFC